MPISCFSQRFLVALLLVLATSLLLIDTVAAQQDQRLPRCVEDGSVYLVEAGTVSFGSISSSADTPCADPYSGVRSLEIVSQPTAPSLVYAYGSWTYLFGAYTADGNTVANDDLSFTAIALCNDVAVCEAIIRYVATPKDEEEKDDSSGTIETSTMAPSVKPLYPLCSTSAVSRVYPPSSTRTDAFPLDVQATECNYIAEITSQPSIGYAAVMLPRFPLQYVFATSGIDEDAQLNTTLPYTVSCEGEIICEDAVTIELRESADACPNSDISYTVKPGTQLSDTLNTGAQCAGDYRARVRASTVLSPGTLPPASMELFFVSGLFFTYTAPQNETTILMSIRTYCDEEPLCDTNVTMMVTTDSPPPSTTDQPTTAPPTTDPPVPIPMCGRQFAYTVPVGKKLRGTFHVPFEGEEECAITTYNAQRNSTLAGILDVNIIGDFVYDAPEEEAIDQVLVSVYCVATLVCRAPVVFTAFTDLNPTPSPTNTELPTEDPVPACANVYYYQTAPGVAISDSLAGVPGQDPCAHGRYFTLTYPPQLGRLELMPVGDFLYIPTAEEGNYEFTFSMYCLNRLTCTGSAYLLVSNRWTLPPTSQRPTSTQGPADITHPQITCKGTCTSKAWLTYPKPAMWDNTPGAGYARKDGHPVNGITVSWANKSLIFSVYTIIGNLGVRFPTFEPISSGAVGHNFLRPEDLVGSIAPSSPGFQLGCLAYQGITGMGEDVWHWNTLGNGTGTGTVGSMYNAGQSWYQKFGGKHDQCDTFADPCRYAPLLTPANASAPNAIGKWTMNVDDCDATWTGVFPLTSLEQLTKSNREPVFSFIADKQVKGTLVTEAVRPHSWINPASGFDTNYDGHDIIITMNQFVTSTVDPLDNGEPYSVDAKLFTYRADGGDNGPGDLAFGINMLVYPYLLTPSPEEKHPRPLGFKWVEQHWEAPDMEQCPTCTGSRTDCTVDTDFNEHTYTGEFPAGNCPKGVGRVILSKGPATREGECPPHESVFYNRSGFSPTYKCETSYQNLTLRGVIPGSGALTEAQARRFFLQGSIVVEVLLPNAALIRVELRLSLYVARLAQDTVAAQGGLLVCRSGGYWPVLDPLGHSLADSPFELSTSPVAELCVDALSTTFGPDDWAVFTLSLPGLVAEQVQVSRAYLLDVTSGERVFVYYRDPSTGEATLPPPALGYWWARSHSYLAFRDLSARVVNRTIVGVKGTAPVPRPPGALEDVLYAFTFVPGAYGANATIEVVIDAVITINGRASTNTFSRPLNIAPYLTQVSRDGPDIRDESHRRDDSKGDFYAIGVIAGVTVVLVATAVFFMFADNSRPLPKWVPRGKLIKKTVLSILPTGLKPKKKTKRIKHKDMYDAMSSGKY